MVFLPWADLDLFRTEHGLALCRFEAANGGALLVAVEELVAGAVPVDPAAAKLLTDRAPVLPHLWP